jgi:hypothetical protein
VLNIDGSGRAPPAAILQRCRMDWSDLFSSLALRRGHSGVEQWLLLFTFWPERRCQNFPNSALYCVSPASGLLFAVNKL